MKRKTNVPFVIKLLEERIKATVLMKMAGQNLKSKQKNGANSKFIKIIMNMYIHEYTEN